MRWSAIGKFRLFREQTGLTILEVLVCVGILGLIGTSVVLGLDTVSRSTRIQDEKVVAINLASDHLEAIEGMSYAATYPNAGENITIPFQYMVTINTECSDDGTTFDTCIGADNETIQKIVVSVSREGRPVLSLCTYRTKR